MAFQYIQSLHRVDENGIQNLDQFNDSDYELVQMLNTYTYKENGVMNVICVWKIDNGLPPTTLLTDLLEYLL